MSNAQASEASHRPNFSPYPLFLYAIVSSIVSWLFLSQFMGFIFFSRFNLVFNPVPGYFCAQVTLLGIIAGLVGRHWLHGMALSLGLQTVICTLAYGLDIAYVNDELYAITGRHGSSMIFLPYSVLTVVLPAIPSLLMRKLQSWRLVLNPTPYKSSGIQGLLVATTFVAMITASAIQSYIPAIDYSIVFGALGACTVLFFLPVVRMSLEESSVTGSSQVGSTFSPRPKAEVVAYSLLLGIAGMVVLTPFKPLIGLWIGLHYVVFIVCLWTGIWCLGASGLRFRNQSMDDKAQSLSSEHGPERVSLTTQSLDIAQSPFSDDTCETRQDARDPAEILGRWSLVVIAAIIAGFTLFKMWAMRH